MIARFGRKRAVIAFSHCGRRKRRTGGVSSSEQDALKVRGVIKRLTEAGWTLERMHGDHRQFKREEERELVTLSGHPSGEVSPGQLQDIR